MITNEPATQATSPTLPRRLDSALTLAMGIALAGLVLLLAHFGLERAGRALLDTDSDPRLQVDAPRGYAGTTREARRAALRLISEVQTGLLVGRHRELVAALTFEVNAAALDLTDDQRSLGSWTALVESHAAFVEADKAWAKKLEETDDSAEAAAEETLQTAWAKAGEAFHRSERQLRSAY